MFLSWSHVVNACQHVDRRIEFGAGTTAIVGPNGFGKTNFVELTRATVTNDFRSMGGAKDINVRRGKLPDEPAFIESCWLTPAGEVIVRRGLAHAQSKLSVNGVDIKDLYGRETAITEEVLKLLDTSADVLNDYMFADSAALNAIVKGTKTERVALFTSLCGVGVIAKLDEALRMQLSADTAVCAEFSPASLDEAVKDCTKAKLTLESIYIELAEKDELLLPDTEFKDMLTKLTRLADAATKVTEAKDNVAKIADRIRKHDAVIATSDAEVAELTTQVEQLTVSYQSLVENVITLKQEVLDYGKVTAAAKIVSNAKLTLKPEPVKPTREAASAEDASRDELVATKLKIEQEGAKVKRELELIESSGQGTCQTCGQAVDVSPERQAQLKQRQLQLRSKYVVTKKLIESIDEFAKLDADYEKAKQAWALSQASAKASIAANSTLAKQLRPGVTLEGLTTSQRAAETKCKTVAESLRTSRKKLAKASETSTVVADRKQRDTEELSQLREYVKTHPAPLKVTVDKLSAAVEQQQELRERIRDLKFQAQATRSTVATKLKVLREAKSKRRRVSKLLKCVDVQKAARPYCGKDGLPAIVVNEMLDLTTERVNHILQRLSATFYVRPQRDDFSFIAIHSDNSEEPARRLSTGQGLVLGIAFWLARAATFAGKLPLFCLDEPTAHIDAARLLDIADMLRVLSEDLLQENRQGIIITHDVAIAASCTRCFDLQQGTYINNVEDCKPWK